MNQQTKFDYIIQALDNNTADRVQAIILSPPESPYDKLKAALIGIFGKTQAEKDHELQLGPSNRLLFATIGTPIRSFGTRQIELQLGPASSRPNPTSLQDPVPLTVFK